MPNREYRVTDSPEVELDELVKDTYDADKQQSYENNEDYEDNPGKYKSRKILRIILVIVVGVDILGMGFLLGVIREKNAIQAWKSSYITLENMNKSLTEEYNFLVEEYNALVEEYNSLLEEYRSITVEETDQ